MTADITLLRSFVDGQGAGAGTYTGYAPDLDENFTKLQNAFNSLNAEFKAFGGQNASLVFDLSTTQTLTVGIIGAGSFVASFISGNTTLRVTRGEALTGQGRVTTTGTTDLAGSGSSGTRYAALRTTGVITLETAAGQGALDLWSANWNGSSFDVGTLLRLPGTGANNVIVDADDFQAARVQENFNQSTNAVLAPFTYDRIANRLDDVVRVLGGRLTSSVSGQTLKGIAFGGAVGAPGIMLSDGTTYDTTTGFFRPVANQLGITVQGTEAMRFSRATVGQPQAEVRAGTALATPPWSWTGDLDTGWGWISADYFRAIAGGVSVLELRTGVGGLPKALVPLGVVGNPTLSFVGDENTGIYSPGADQWALATAGVQALLVNPQGQRTSATQGRCSASQSGTQNLANATTTNVQFNTEQYDVGGFHDPVTNSDRFTVPTGFAGVYAVKAWVTFNEASAAGGGVANAGQRAVQITLNGTVIAEQRVNAAAAGDTTLAVSIDAVAAATDIFRATAQQSCGGTMNITTSRCTVRLAD